MSCLDENTLVALMERSLPRPDLERVTAHLDKCAACRKLVSAMASWYPVEPWQQRTDPVTIHAPTTAAPPPPPGELGPGTRVDRYLLLRPIASGGMSVVFAAYDPELDRRLAIKFLRSQVREPVDDARLLREAQVMARLSHPNVVQLYDVGLFGDRVFLVMELIEGSTLRHWLGKGRHTRSEVMEVMLAAGRGLAEAHRNGVVHRDFKPENVLVGEDGRARVMDFGLARAYQGSAILSISQEPVAGMSVGQLTRPGVVMGTPGYMAPEQLAGGRGDARSDQFAFCCALYEGLAGARPYAGTQLDDYMASMASARQVKPLPALVPSRVRGAVMRGLSLDPAQRFASMDELLDALHLPFWRRLNRRQQLGAGALAGAVAVLALGIALRAPGARCGDPRDELAGVWDEARRTAVVAAMEKASDPVRAQATSDALERYARRWVSAAEAVCLARGTRAAEDDAGARGCLLRRRADLAAAVELLSSPDQSRARRAVAIAAAPPLPDECRTARQPVAPATGDAALRERVRARVSKARALLAAGRPTDAAGALGSAAAEAGEAGDPALEPEAYFVRASLLAAQGSLAEAEASLYKAVWASERTRHDVQAARAWIALYRLAGADRQDEGRAQELREHAVAAVARVGPAPLLVAELDAATGEVLAALGKPASAMAPLEQALGPLQQELGPEDPSSALPQELFGDVQGQLGQLAQAEGTLKSVLAMDERLYGADHPRTASARVRLGAVLSRRGLHEEAVKHFRDALLISDAPGCEDPLLAYRVRFALGEAFRRIGHLGDARMWHEEALRAIKPSAGSRPLAASSHLALAAILRAGGDAAQALPLDLDALANLSSSPQALDGVGQDHLLLGHRREAVDFAQRALAQAEKALGKDQPGMARYLVDLGAALGAAGEHGEALARHQRALDLLKAAYGPTSPLLRPALVAQAAELEALGQTTRARAALEAAVALAQTRDPEEAEARFALARALSRSAQEHERAMILAHDARDLFEQLQDKPEEDRVSQWLAHQPRSSAVTAR